MMFTAAALTSTLLALNALALPTSKDRLAARLARRGGGGVRAGKPRGHLDSLASAVHADATGAGDGTGIQYSNNWAGIVYESYPAGTFQAVTAKFAIPTPTAPSGGSPQQSYAASVWVGIDGDTCQSAILQTGLDLVVQGGQVSFAAWYEYFPDYAYDFENINFSVGDIVEMTVVADSYQSGTAYINNLSTGQNVSKYLESNTPMCLQNAEWIVEDFQQSGSLVPLANWTSIVMYDAVAELVDGSFIGPSAGTVLDLAQNVTDTDGSISTIVYSTVAVDQTAIRVDYIETSMA